MFIHFQYGVRSRDDYDLSLWNVIDDDDDDVDNDTRKIQYLYLCLCGVKLDKSGSNVTDE